MAGDFAWIKVRGTLVQNPRVMRMARELMEDVKFREWLTPGGGGGANSQIVSDVALRCVTTALLTVTWSVARECGKFVGDDLFLPRIGIDDIDGMAGCPGFGRAMMCVGWAKTQGDPDGIIFPNFKEFNVPPMTSAEKQRAYRERMKRPTGSTHDEPLHGVTIDGNQEQSRADKSIRYATLRTAIDKLDWAGVRRLAHAHIQKADTLPDHDNRLLVYQAAAMVKLGVLPEMWFVEPIARLAERQKKRAKRIKNPMAWLTKVFKTTATDHGQDFHELRGIINVPEWLLNGKPEGEK